MLATNPGPIGISAEVAGRVHQTRADILGLSADLGTIETGKIADLIAIDDDPLTTPDLFNTPHRIPLVIKNGQIVKDTR